MRKKGGALCRGAAQTSAVDAVNLGQPSSGAATGGGTQANQPVVVNGHLRFGGGVAGDRGASGGPPGDEGDRACSCRKTRCLKMWCACFARGALCSPESGCLCVDCANNSEHDSERRQAIEEAKRKNPNAFNGDSLILKRKDYAKRMCPGCLQLVPISTRRCQCGQDLRKDKKTGKGGAPQAGVRSDAAAGARSCTNESLGASAIELPMFAGNQTGRHGGRAHEAHVPAAKPEPFSPVREAPSSEPRISDATRRTQPKHASRGADVKQACEVASVAVCMARADWHQGMVPREPPSHQMCAHPLNGVHG